MSRQILFKRLSASCSWLACPGLTQTAVPAKTDPAALPPLALFRDCDSCPEMIVMPPGTFWMGAIPGKSKDPFDIYAPVDAKNFKPRVRGPDEIKIIPNEHPRHRVEMDIPYAIARNETTKAEWMALSGRRCTMCPIIACIPRRVTATSAQRPGGQRVLPRCP